MKELTGGERVRKALQTRDQTELEWAMTWVREQLAGTPAEDLRKYWVEIERRVSAALEA
jgi:hypothetical protein